MADTDLLELSLEDAAGAIRSGALSAAEYSAAFIAQSERQLGLGAYVSWDWERLMSEARAVDAKAARTGDLEGVPLAIKDNINTRSLPTTAATGALKGFVAAADSPAVAPLFAAGALLGAKANMHELAFGITSNNAVTGAARNPYDPTRIPGGSSGGVATAVAARMMPAGIGTDTGASVRLPAALCGLVGFRPTVGRYSRKGIVPISATRDTPGPITRSVGDAILIDRLMSGDPSPVPPVAARGLRIGLPHDYFSDALDPEVRAALETAVAALAKAGVMFVREDLGDIGAVNAAVSFPVALYEFMRDLPAYLAENAADITMKDIQDGVGSPDVRSLVDSLMDGGAIPEAVYRQAIEVDRPRLQKLYADYFAGHRVEAILFPTSPMVARPIGEDETVAFNGERAPTFAAFIRNTDPGSNAAIPGISLPVALSPSGLPIGLEFDGPARADARLLAVARAIEEVIGFKGKPPVV